MGSRKPLTRVGTEPRRVRNLKAIQRRFRRNLHVGSRPEWEDRARLGSDGSGSRARPGGNSSGPLSTETRRVFRETIGVRARPSWLRSHPECSLPNQRGRPLWQTRRISLWRLQIYENAGRFLSRRFLVTLLSVVVRCAVEGSPSVTLFELLSKSRARDFDGRHWLVWFNGEFDGWTPFWFASRSDIEPDAKTGLALAPTVNWCVKKFGRPKSRHSA